MLFDTHAHYDDAAFNEDRGELLECLPKHDIEYVVNIGSGFESVEKSIKLAESYGYIYAAVGIHPEETAGMDEERLSWLKEKAKHPKALAVGEIGLDYYWDTPDRDIQKKWFIRQIELAKELDKPIVIHSRDAANDTYNILKESKVQDLGVVLHCFGYGVELARLYLDMGFYLGIGGVVTFTNGRKLKEVVAYAPLEQLVLETDCPYLAPVPFRGKRNSSLYLPYIAREIASIKNIDYETVIRVTNNNAKKLYRMEGS